MRVCWTGNYRPASRHSQLDDEDALPVRVSERCHLNSNMTDDLLSASTSSTRLYEAMGLSKTATPAEIRKAYFKLSLKVHPDRNPDDPDATARFQSLQKIYAVLSDPDRRKLYDETGITDADDPDAYSEDRCESLRAFYKAAFKPVTGDAIDELKKTYQGSEEEEAEVLSRYTEFEGDMEKLFGHVLLSEEAEDSARFSEMIERALEDGRLTVRYGRYETWRKKLSKKKKSKGTSTKKTTRKNKKNESAAGDFNDLAAAILAKRPRSESQTGLGALASKYGVALPEDPLDDAAFEAARARLTKNK